MDFSLELEWDTGALPLQNHYSYAVLIGLRKQAQFIYSLTYEPLTQPDAWRADIALKPAQMDNLYALL